MQWRNCDFIRGAFNLDAANWARNPNNWTYIRKIGGSPLQIPWKQFIDPKNWGPNASEESIFYGIEQPAELKDIWETEKNRPKIKFKPLD